MSELDKRIALEVMGWKYDATIFGGEGGWIEPVNGWWDTDVPEYSTEINPAWQVVEHMRELGWSCEMSGFDDWYVEFAKIEDHLLIIRHRNADTAPEAICLAALAAMGKGGDE
jgi:hypothetical protein